MVNSIRNPLPGLRVKFSKGGCSLHIRETEIILQPDSQVNHLNTEDISKLMFALAECFARIDKDNSHAPISNL